MKRCVTTSLAALLAVAATACSGAGDLENGTFHYVCTSDYDFSCEAFSWPDLEATIAVGAAFDLEYVSDGSDVASLSFAGVRPASEQVAERISSSAQRGMRFVVAGEGAFIAHGLDDTVLDFTYLLAEEVVAVDLTGEDVAGDTLFVRADETSRIVAHPLGLGDEHLIGSMSCTWSVDDGAMLWAPTGVSSCAIDVDALAPGQTTLRVQMNEAVATELTILVEDPS